MTKRQNIVTLAVGAVIITALVFIIFLELVPSSTTNPIQEAIITGDPEATLEQKEERPRDWEETEFRKAVPADIKIPETGDVMSDDLKNVIAVPATTVPAISGSSIKIRAFVIKAENNQFTPENIIVNFNDSVEITFEAVDKEYDITVQGYNLKQVAKQGEVKTLSFQANQDGRFFYYCNSCGGMESSARGEIIVVK